MTLPLDDDGLVERLRAGDGEGWALLKRGLYWRPNGQGYTGLKSEAGIYSDQQASAYVEHGNGDGTTKIRWVDAPDLSPSRSTETALLYYISRTLAAEAREKAMQDDAERYRFLRARDLETIARGGVFAGLTPQNIVLNGVDLDREVDAARATLSTGAPDGK